MPIAAAVVGEGRLRALLTAIAMPAERGGAALRDRAEHTPMLPGDPRAVGVQEAVAMSAHDVGHLEGWPRHRLCFRRVRRAVSGPAIGSASSGLATACRCFCERWRYSAVCRIPRARAAAESCAGRRRFPGGGSQTNGESDAGRVCEAPPAGPRRPRIPEDALVKGLSARQLCTVPGNSHVFGRIHR